jgi:hypothetical protein
MDADGQSYSVSDSDNVEEIEEEEEMISNSY